MDTDKLLAHARSRFDHAAAKRILKEKYQAKLIFTSQGGMWRAGPELLNVLAICLQPETVILDLYENPVKIKTQDLLAETQQRWQEQMTAWLVEYDAVVEKR